MFQTGRQTFAVPAWGHAPCPHMRWTLAHSCVQVLFPSACDEAAVE